MFVTYPFPSPSTLDMLGVAEQAMAGVDPVSFISALFAAGAALPLHPERTACAATRLAAGCLGITAAALRRTVGDMAAAPFTGSPGDRRFTDRAYEENPYFFTLHQAHLLAWQFAQDLIDAAGRPVAEANKARFAARFILDALAPTNTLLGNPAALRTAFDTGGKSIVRGLRNLVADVRHNGGRPSQVDTSGFEVGASMAATKGKVVYRSDLIELIQYEPSTPEVHSIPLLFCPPWINKYYIMDLAPGRSLIEWSVNHGHTCFAISYRNPDDTMRDLDFEDYLMQGPLDAIRVVRAITGAPRLNLLSLCLGGTLTAIALAYLAREGESVIASATFLNSHTDFTMPGALGVFVDEAAVKRLERKMEKRGYLEAADMAHTFDALRANDLIFGYVINNWLLGNPPPAFDLLAWNADSTRMPAKMHTRYLRSFYLQNDFAEGRFVVQGAPVDPGAADVDTYVLSAIDDHIVPWMSAYKTTQLLGGQSRFVLSTSGHIAGIVNPPSPKSKHWTNDSVPPDPQVWLQGAQLHSETWWWDWLAWLAARAGPMVRSSENLGSSEYPVIEDAPGLYVRARSA